MARMEWRDIPDFGNHYQASADGRVRVKDRVVRKRHSKSKKVEDFFYSGRELTQFKSSGYWVVRFGVDNKKLLSQVGRMVLLAFRGVPKEGYFCRHLNGNPLDNRIDNLAWGTQKDNMADRKIHGKYAVGEKHPMAKLTKNQVEDIKKSALTGTALAKKYGMGNSQISRIRRGLSWQQ